MQKSRIISLVSMSCFLLFCLSCREAIGEQQGTTPPKNEVPSPKKEDIRKTEPEKVVPQRNHSIPPKSKNGPKPNTLDTLAPKIALS